jgi:hypothetical protein
MRTAIILFCLLPLCAAGRANAAELDATEGSDLWWVALGAFGFTYAFPAKEATDADDLITGLPIYWSLSYNWRRLPWLMLTVRGSIAHLLFWTEEYDKGALLSVVGKTLSLNFSLGAGIGGAWVEDLSADWKWVVGLPVEAQFFLVITRRFGLGVVAFANINAVRLFGGWTVCLTAGRLRNWDTRYYRR